MRAPVVEEGLGPNETPSTVSAHLPRSGRGESPEEPTELELGLLAAPDCRRADEKSFGRQDHLFLAVALAWASPSGGSLQ